MIDVVALWGQHSRACARFDCANEASQPEWNFKLFLPKRYNVFDNFLALHTILTIQLAGNRFFLIAPSMFI